MLDETGDHVAIPGEVVDDEYVVLAADLLADPGAAAVHLRPSDDPTVVSDVLFRGATFRNVWFERARFSGVYVDGLDWWTWGRDLGLFLDGFTINGVEIGPLVEAELDRRHPERQHLKELDTVEQLRAAYPHLEAMWAPTIEWARSLPEAVLREHVDGEFSFVETLRHLVFAADAWIRRLALGQQQPFHSLALAYPDDRGCWSADGTTPWASAGIDIDADPTLDEVLAAREENFTLIRTTLDQLDDEQLRSTAAAPTTPGYPPGTVERTIVQCFRSNVNEEWWHHQYARRDLAVLAGD